MGLEEYRSKRRAESTPEPFGGDVASLAPANSGIFVIQKHSARALHYDFRLEMEGVLRSWAVPRGPSLDPADKRLAVAVEDHPLEYGDFEGVIPEGNYGAGEVIVWDRGTYTAVDPPTDPAGAVRKGKLDIFLRGYKLHGTYTLVRTGGRTKDGAKDNRQWLLIKKRDEYAKTEDVLTAHPRSVLSGLTVEEMLDAPAAGREVAKELEKLGAPKIEGPLRAEMFPPMLAKPADDAFDNEQWMFELKYDGVRALAIRDGGQARLFARRGAEITARYPEVVLAMSAMAPERFAIDGEIVTLDEQGKPSFQLLQHRMHVHDARKVARLSFAMPALDFVFDLLAFDNYDLRSMPLETRKRLLGRLVRGEGPVRFTDYVIGRGKDFYEVVSASGFEGMVAKRRDSKYRAARNGDWLKIKCPVVESFVIGGYTDPGGSRTHFGALLLGQYEADGSLRYTDKVGTGFDFEKLRAIRAMLDERRRDSSPFRSPNGGEPSVERGAHFAEPDIVCEVRFTEWTDGGGIRHPSFVRIVDDADPKMCSYRGPVDESDEPDDTVLSEGGLGARGAAIRQAAGNNGATVNMEVAEITNPEKVFWPAEGYTKGDLVEYYRAISRWMLPYLKDRPVMMTRYPDGIEGKMFYQKDAPDFAPAWLRRKKIYSEDSHREIAYFVIESEEALAYVANLATITIHIWSSRIAHLERPDWLLFDIDPKGTTTPRAVEVAQQVAVVLREIGLEPCLKTSGQMGLHVMVGLKPRYTYEQARMFAELVSRVVVNRMPEVATINRNPRSRGGKVYIDYLQLGHGKTIAAPYSVRPVPKAPVSAPLEWSALKSSLDPTRFNIKTMPRRAARMKRDPFLDVLEKPVALEDAFERLEALVGDGRPRK